MSVIGHDDKAIKHHQFPQTKRIERVQNQPLHNVALENVQIVNGFGSHKVEIVGVKVWLPWRHSIFLVFADLAIQRHHSKIPTTGQSSAPCRVILDCVLYPVSAQPSVFYGRFVFSYAVADLSIRPSKNYWVATLCWIWQSLQAMFTPLVNTHKSQAHRAAGLAQRVSAHLFVVKPV